MRFTAAIFGLLLLAPSLRAQSVVELSGGVSNLFGSGGGFVLYGPGGETHFSAGIINGRFAYNAAENFMFHEWEVGLGDNQFAITGGQMYLNAPVRGVSLTRRRKHDELRVFSGAVGQTYSSPYFFGIQKTHIGAGFGYKRELTNHWTLGTIQAATGKRTSLEEADYKRGHFEVHGQGGWLENNLQLNGSATASWTHLGGSAGRSTYVFSQPQSVEPGLPTRITVNNFSAYGGYSRFSGSASIFQSTLNTGKSFNVGTRVSFLQVQAGSYTSGKLSSQLLTFTEHSLHWSLSQYITRSGGSTTYNFGGSYTSNRLNFQVGYSMLYFPALPQPFQKVLSANVGFRLRGVAVQTGTTVQPNGRNQWSVGGDDYLQTRLHVPSMPGATSEVRSLPSAGHGGKYVVEGWVTDDKNNPIEGAAILIGKDEVFTDTTGHFSVREKHAVNPIKIDFDNFITSGEWEPVSVPAETRGEHVKIVVRRKYGA